MDKNYYIEYYKLERENWWFKARLSILKNQISKITSNHQNLSILNIGAATGATSIMLENFGKVISVEYDEPCFRFVKENLKINIIQGSILNLPFQDNTFDVVCAFDVIEHVENDAKAVAEMQRVCKNNGFVFVTVPAFMSLWSQHDVVNHHYRRYRLKNLIQLFTNGFIIDYKTYFNTILFLPVFVIRFISNSFPELIKRSGSGSDFGMIKSTWLNNLFYYIFLLEKPFLNWRFRFPFGVSAMLIARKTA